ncbi:13874_t:CDS:2 [Funneliformis mosseae]|uniref:13874_t:CDS:1 n=1 Tax=Funneliformis mosseae TaxID=27381 RepID=A0A9N8YVE8_FUNMO|nr:13874_t:CDS:2 [Funneliformis mosseae]
MKRLISKFFICRTKEYIYTVFGKFNLRSTFLLKRYVSHILLARPWISPLCEYVTDILPRSVAVHIFGDFNLTQRSHRSRLVLRHDTGEKLAHPRKAYRYYHKGYHPGRQSTIGLHRVPQMKLFSFKITRGVSLVMWWHSYNVGDDEMITRHITTGLRSEKSDEKERIKEVYELSEISNEYCAIIGYRVRLKDVFIAKCVPIQLVKNALDLKKPKMKFGRFENGSRESSDSK